jgi:ribulose-bisphosphate carboxylase large chain
LKKEVNQVLKLHYIDKKYTPGKKDLICEFYLEPNKIKIEEAAEHIAKESSIGTWTTIATMNKSVAKSLRPKVYNIDKKRKTIKIAYPSNLFEAGSIPQIYSAIAGNIFGMKAIKNLRLLDIHFPRNIAKAFKGPLFGIDGIRRMARVKKRPLVGTIVKPKVGLSAKQHANVAYESWVGGLDLVKDDENLTSMVFNKWKDRFYHTLKARDKAEKETGEKKLYMANCTAETAEMIRRADYVKSLGGEHVMVDILTCGWSGLQSVRDHINNQAIHAHRAMHGAMTRNPKHGISMLALAKTARLIGVDQLHIGTAGVGKMHGSTCEEVEIEEEIETDMMHAKPESHILEQDWYGIKPVFAVASGGLSPLSLPPLLKKMGTNIIAQFGGGCHGHPGGPRQGAKAIRQALDASLAHIPLKEYAKVHPELKRAIDKWG